jgi:hypothetical protein
VTNTEAQEILAALPKYELVDITVVSTDGLRATADVVYTVDGGDLKTTRVEFFKTARDGGTLIHLTALGDEFSKQLGAEIKEECREACAYQRDFNKALN